VAHSDHPIETVLNCAVEHGQRRAHPRCTSLRGRALSASSIAFTRRERADRGRLAGLLFRRRRGSHLLTTALVRTSGVGSDRGEQGPSGDLDHAAALKKLFSAAASRGGAVRDGGNDGTCHRGNLPNSHLTDDRSSQAAEKSGSG
jgi:hypothetical protein